MPLLLDTLGRRWRALGSRARYWLALALALLFFAAAVTWRYSGGARPRLFQLVVDEVGMRQVEALAPELRVAAHESGVDPLLLAAICFHESRGRSGQVSSAGALGLMQLVPAAAADAARRLGLERPSEEQLLHDAALNLRLGAAHLGWLLEHRGGWSLEQVLVAYNAGRARLMRWIEESGGYSGWAREQERRLEAGQPTSGALRYARGVLATRAAFVRRGRLGPGSS